MFNLFQQTKKELTDFIQNKVHIAGTRGQGQVKYLKTKNIGYDFSQWDTLNTVEMYSNSRFKTGETDSEGQRKVFLNISSFRVEVATKQVDIDVKDFVFIPEPGFNPRDAIFINKRFHQWAKPFFGQTINDLTQDYPKYGSCVAKRVGNTIERVPLLTLRNDQAAKSLQDARYVIIEHKEMTLDDIEANEEWDTDGFYLKFGDTTTVYERYGKVPMDYYKELKGQQVEDGDEMRGVDTMSIIAMKEHDNKVADGHTLFIEKIEGRPFEEAHWRKQDGRWLGVGEVEKQFENQVVRNMTINLRKRNLMWASKKVFQSPDTQIAKNLVRDVKDGEILHIMPNGNVTQVNMQTQAAGDFSAMDSLIENNSNQKSFTFEVATGEALPSGTPFRLGVILSNAVNSYFGLKRENLGLFFKRIVRNQVYEIFQEENREEHIVGLVEADEGFIEVKNLLTDFYTNKNAKEEMLSGNMPDMEKIKNKVIRDMKDKKVLPFRIPKGYFDRVRVSTELVITGESTDIPKRLETLTTLFNILSQKQDPRADEILTKILALTGESLEEDTEPQNALAQGQQGMEAMQGAFGQAAQAPQAQLQGMTA